MTMISRYSTASIRRQQGGLGRWTALIFLTITGLVVWIGYNVLPFYYCYYELLNQFEQHAKVASMYTDAEIREKLMYHIRKLEIPIDKPEDLLINRDGRTMQIRLKYKEIFYITWKGKDYDLYIFPFDANMKRNF